MSTDLPALMEETVAAPASQQPRPRTYVPAIDHALKAYALQRDRADRLTKAAAATAQMFAAGMDAGDWDELWAMQGAIHARFAGLQKSWLDGWFAWARYADQIEGANTLSKFAAREYNIAAQAVQLMGDQSESLAGLVENIEVGYLYWVSRKTR